MFNVTLSKLLSSSISFTVTYCIVWRSLGKSSLKVLVTIWISNVNFLCNSLSSDYWLYSSTRLSLPSSTLFYKVALEYTYIYNYILHKYIIYICIYITFGSHDDMSIEIYINHKMTFVYEHILVSSKPQLKVWKKPTFTHMLMYFFS